MRKHAALATVFLRYFLVAAIAIYASVPTFSALAADASVPVRYHREAEGAASSSQDGALTVLTIKGQPSVPVKQFCGSLGCKAFYRWDRQRLVISNSFRKSVAVLSPLIPLVDIDGRVFRYQGTIEVTREQGYLLPLSLVKELTTRMGMGAIIEEAPEKKTVADAPESQAAQELKTVIIDAGHGGFDMGTTEGRLYEKDIAMFYAQQLKAALLAKVSGITVVLTREKDRFMSLAERARFANERGAGLFISLHVNHADDPNASGAETYILSPEATDSDARKTQLLENQSWVRNARVASLPTEMSIKTIFVDLEQQHFIRQSALFGSYCQQELAQIDAGGAVKNRGVKQAFFYVLSQAAMPAVLVEMGFLSNTQDRDRLMNAEFREKFTNALVTAVVRYKARLISNKQALE
jgi:N-acetylmuramoyl-L-alanine amidase